MSGLCQGCLIDDPCFCVVLKFMILKPIIATRDYRACDKSRLQESELESESMMSSTPGVTPTPTPMESTSPTLDSPNTNLAFYDQQKLGNAIGEIGHCFLQIVSK